MATEALTTGLPMDTAMEAATPRICVPQALMQPVPTLILEVETILRRPVEIKRKVSRAGLHAGMDQETMVMATAARLRTAV